MSSSKLTYVIINLLPIIIIIYKPLYPTIT